MWQDIKTWFESKGGFTHTVAGVYSGAILAYSVVPAFHQLVIDVWAKTPPAAREVGLAVAGLVAWYTSAHKTLSATVDASGNVKVEGNPVVKVEVEGKKP